MPETMVLVVGVACFIAGGLLVLLFERSKRKSALAVARAEADTQSAVLQERDTSKDIQLTNLAESLNAREKELLMLRSEISLLQMRRSELETLLNKERKVAEEKLELLSSAQTQLQDAFKALSSEALKSNNQSFIELATQTLNRFQEGAKGDLEKRTQAIDALVKPMRESLDKFDNKIQEIEKARVGAYEGLSQQVKYLIEAENKLRDETKNLSLALRSPQVRGRWGELQLRRVVELAGMVDHCDFFEQQSTDTEEGRFRPDLIVRLPGGRNIVIDAKAPLAGYLDALEARDDEAKNTCLANHTRHIREHMASLGRKSYWENFTPTPEFVVLFLPGEVFFSAALEQDPSLIEQGVEEGVVVATPTTLIALLKAVAFGWKQERLAENAKQIAELGQEIYRRLGDLGTHFSDLGQRLGKAVESYNKAVGTLETRVLVSGRRFRELDASRGEGEIGIIDPVEVAPRQIQAPELQGIPITGIREN
jgi:DNA recombination protein RmuC